MGPGPRNPSHAAHEGLMLKAVTAKPKQVKVSWTFPRMQQELLLWKACTPLQHLHCESLLRFEGVRNISEEKPGRRLTDSGGPYGP